RSRPPPRSNPAGARDAHAPAGVPRPATLAVIAELPDDANLLRRADHRHAGAWIDGAARPAPLEHLARFARAARGRPAIRVGLARNRSLARRSRRVAFGAAGDEGGRRKHGESQDTQRRSAERKTGLGSHGTSDAARVPRMGTSFTTPRAPRGS